MYDDPVMMMVDMRHCPGWGKDPTDGSDVVFIDNLRNHPWRVEEVQLAQVFIIPIPVAASFSYNKECGGTHIDRVTRAFKRLIAHPIYQMHNASHYLHCHHWNCFVGWDWPKEEMLPLQLYQEANLSNIIMGRYENYRTTAADCEQYNGTFGICRQSGPINPYEGPASGIFLQRWELCRCAVVVPYLADGSLHHLQPTFEEWRKRKNTVFHYTSSKEFLWNATNLRRTPVNHNLSRISGVQVGLDKPQQEWLSELEQSKFCLVMRGDTPSSHGLINAIKVGCVPVILSDSFQLVGQPFPTQLPWSLFTVALSEQAFAADPYAVLRFLWQFPVRYQQSLLKHLKQSQSALLYEAKGDVEAYILRQIVQDCL
jgi:hypothetical protein